MFKGLLIFLIIFLPLALGAQSYVVITSNVSSTINMCNEQPVFSVRINNPSPYLTTNGLLTIDLPQGVNYVPSSITVASEQNISNLNQPVFDVPDLGSITITDFTFQLEVGCDAIAFLTGGGIPQNDVTFNYTANTNNITQTHQTSNYNINVPNLSVSSFTNQTLNGGAIGGTYQRCITITNGGTGYLSEFTIQNNHGTGITINSVDVGTQSSVGSISTITLDGTDFSGFGDFDNRLETGESITICEDFTVNNCSDVLSSYDIFWGCNGSQCQNVPTTSNVLFSNTSPLIKHVSITSDNNFCHGSNVTRTEGFVATNIGNGTAIDSKFRIFQSWTSAYFSNAWYSSIDTASIMVSINGATAVHKSPYSISNNASPYSTDVNSICSPVNIGQYYLNIDTLEPTDTIEITWEVIECDPVGCYPGRRHSIGWFYEVEYDNICSEDFLMEPVRGRAYDYWRETMASNLAPSNITSGQTLTFNYLIPIHEKAIRRDVNNDEFIYKIVLPGCLTYGGNFRVLSETNGVLATEASSYVIGDTTFIVAEYGNVGNFGNGQIEFDLSANCVNCGNTSGAYPIEIYSTYNSDTTCTSNVTYQLACFQTQVYVVCPSSCEGFNFNDFVVRRTNLGLPDNDNDGTPDAAGALDMNLVRDDRAMFNDTIEFFYAGGVTVNGATPNLDYLTINSDIDYGIYLTYLDGDLLIYDQSTGTSHIATGVTTSSDVLAGHVRQIVIEEQLSTLAFVPALPGGFVLDDLDSINFTSRYRVSGNTTSNLGGSGGSTANNIFESKIANNIYLSDVVAAPVANQYGCNELEGYITLIGYYHTNSGAATVNHENCDTVNITRLIYYSVGPCCSNYAGGNLFPYEFRNWIIDDSIRVTLPGEYEVVGVTYEQYKSVGYGVAAQGQIPMTPTSGVTTGTDFTYNIKSLHDNGTLQLSDEGHYAYMRFKLVPTCNTPKAVLQRANFNFYRTESYNGDNIVVRNPYVNLRFDGPELNIQAALPTVNAFDSIGEWDVTLSNNSNISNADNTWVNIPSSLSVTVTEVDTNGVVIAPNANGFYELGSLAFGNSVDIHIKARYTSCSRDSLIFYTGWACNGYPTALAAYDCTPDSVKLYVVPQLPNLETTIPFHNDTLGLCDTGIMEVKVRNIQTGYAYNVNLEGVIPVGANLILGSTEILIPGSGSFTPSADPVNTIGNTYRWDLSGNELKGIQLGDNEIIVRYKFYTDCDYTSGSQFLFFSEADAACPYSTRSFNVSSEPTIISDAITPYETTVKILTSFISPCKENTRLGISLINNGPQTFLSTDSVAVRLPNGVRFVNGSFVGVYNPPANATPNIYEAGFQEVSWKLPNGVIPGDSVIFFFDIQGNKDSLECSIVDINAFATSTATANCVQSGSPCSIQTITGDTTRSVFIFKSYVSIANDQSTSIIDAPNGEIAYVNFDILNSGDTIADTNQTILSYYHDVDNNGVLSVLDTVFTSSNKFIQINGNNQSSNVLDTINIPAGLACDVIVVVDSSLNGCICSSTQLKLNFTLKSNLPDTITCNNELIVYDGVDSVNGYTYTWTPSANLNATTLAQPSFQKANNTTSQDVNTYFLEIDRGGCLGYDTIAITVLPPPISNAGIDDTICQSNTYVASANAPIIANNERGLWSQSAANPSVATFVDATNNTTTINNLIEGTYNFYWWVFTDCDTARDTVVIDVYNLPTANAGLDDSLCNVYTYTLNGNVPAGRATGRWYPHPANPSVVLIADPTLNNTGVSNFMEGSYKFYWLVQNGNCLPAVDSVVIDIFDAPTATAGMDDSLCNVYSYTLNGNQPTGRATGMWTADISNPIVPSFTDASVYNTTVSGLIEGTHILYWTVSNGNCVAVQDTVIIDVFDNAIAEAGPDDSLCNVYTYTLGGNTLLGRSTGLWTADPANTGVTTFTDDTSPTSTINGLVEGTFTYYWTVSNGNCAVIEDTVVIDVYNEPVSIAGLDDSLCNVYTYTLNGNAPVGRQTATWKESVTNPNAITFDDYTSPTANLSGLIEGRYELYWEVSNGNCDPAIDTVILDVFDTPIANAGVNDSVCDATIYTFNANVPAGRSTGRWTASPANPSATVFTNDVMANTTVLGLLEGTYEFIWTVSNGNCLPVDDTVTIDVFDLPVANAGIDDSLCSVYTYTFSANAAVGRATSMWFEKPTNPSVVTFDDITLNTANITGLIEGSYTFYWVLSNGNCTPSVDSITIEVYDQPVADAGADDSLCNVYSYTFSGNAPVGRASGIWLANPANPSTTVFNNATSFNATATGFVEGTYNFYWVLTNGSCLLSVDTVIIDVYDQPIAVLGNDTTLCNQTSFVLQANVITGRSTGMWVQSATNPPGAVITNPTNPTTAITGLGLGDYQIEWIVSNGSCPPATDDITIFARPNPVASAVTSTQAICENECVDFDATGSTVDASQGDAITRYRWQYGDGSSGESANQNHCYPRDGLYDVQLIVNTNNGCVDTLVLPAEIQVNPLPKADFIYNPTPTKIYEVLTFNQISVGNIFTYNYEFSDGTRFNTPSFFKTFKDTGNYTVELVVTTVEGCRDSIIKPLIILDQLAIFSPNSFSPNGDGFNDKFVPMIQNIEDEEYLFLVFDRWGNKLFETDIRNDAWDGMFKEEMSPTDVYIWRVVYREKGDPETKSIMGHVTIVK